MNTREGIEEIVSKMLAIGWDSKLKKHDGTSIVVSFTKGELCDLLLNLEETHHQELQKARDEAYKAGQSDLIYKLGTAFPEEALEHMDDVINEAHEIAQQLQNQSELDQPNQ